MRSPPPVPALHAVGLSHRTAPVAVREAVAFDPDAQRAALGALAAETGAAEAVLVSTCNRTEIYLRGHAAAAEAAERWLCRRAEGRAALGPHLYRLRGEEVAHHAFRVAAGLDSLVLGEPQILGQLKRAVSLANAAGMCGGALDRLFQQAFSAAKEVRARTALGEMSVGTASAAVRVARQLFGDLSRTRVLFIGAGEMVSRVAARFAAQRPLGMAVANRTAGRGAALAARVGGSAMALAQVPAAIHRFDIVVSCTASTLPIVGKGMVESALRLRKRRPMLLVDLAVPRDVEPEVAGLPDVFLHTIDSLAAVAAEGTRRREAEAARAGRIVAARAAEFQAWLRSRAVVPLIRDLRSRADHDREIEVARARRRLARGDDAIEVVEALAFALTNKLLHPSMRALHRAGPAERETLERLVSGATFRS